MSVGTMIIIVYLLWWEYGDSDKDLGGVDEWDSIKSDCCEWNSIKSDCCEWDSIK